MKSQTRRSIARSQLAFTMARMNRALTLLGLLLSAALLLGMQASPQDIPAYHNSPPAKGTTLPPIFTEKQLSDAGMALPAQSAAYKAAAKVPAVLYQLPCYCYCDRNHGHTSLHTCFESNHGALCGTCMSEAIYAYQMTKKGWSVQQIREGIERGDWKSVNLQHPPTIS